jgi:NAD(P)-dependent dehydrogenase (short-subunit alcohol dehydrogenase family)
MLEHGYSGARAYAQSKLALIMFTFDLAEELRGTGVTANALHPATYMDTKMVLESVGYNLSSISDAATTMRLVTDPKLEGVSGRYYDQLREARAEGQAGRPPGSRSATCSL